MTRDEAGDGPKASRGLDSIPDEIERTVKRLRLSDQGDPEAIIASAFGFVAHDIETVPGASDDARLALRSREGSEIGKSRLLVALLRGAGVDARLAREYRQTHAAVAHAAATHDGPDFHAALRANREAHNALMRGHR